MNIEPTTKVVTISTLVVIRDGRMLLVRKEGATAFILPGGKIEAGESLAQAVRREVREELGCDIVGLAYAATFRDAAADAPGVDVVVHVHVGHLASSPRIQAEIREMVWCNLDAPEVPVAPSLERQIFAHFRGAAQINARLTASVIDMRKGMNLGEYADKHAYRTMINAGVALGEIAPDEVALLKILMPMRDRNAAELSKKRRELAEIDEDIARDARRAIHDADDPRDDASAQRYRTDRENRRNRTVRDITRGEDVMSRLTNDPASLMLPLGTTVRVRPFNTMPGDWPLPVEGTLGVVTGYSTLYGRPNVVAFPQEVMETSGHLVLFDEDEANRYHQVNYLPEELEVMSAGELADGTPVDQPGWWPTHRHYNRFDTLYNESMVVRGAGRLWRIQPSSLLPECTQITLDTQEGRKAFDHLIPLV